MLDTDGIIVECCSANVFWQWSNSVYPVLSHSGVNGLMRQKIISLLQDSQYHLQQVERFANVLTHCDEVVICNALMPVLPVQSIQMDNNFHHYNLRLVSCLSIYFCAAKFKFL